MQAPLGLRSSEHGVRLSVTTSDQADRLPVTQSRQHEQCCTSHKGLNVSGHSRSINLQPPQLTLPIIISDILLTITMKFHRSLPSTDRRKSRCTTCQLYVGLNRRVSLYLQAILLGIRRRLETNGRPKLLTTRQ